MHKVAKVEAFSAEEFPFFTVQNSHSFIAVRAVEEISKASIVTGLFFNRNFVKTGVVLYLVVILVQSCLQVIFRNLIGDFVHTCLNSGFVFEHVERIDGAKPQAKAFMLVLFLYFPVPSPVCHNLSLSAVALAKAGLFIEIHRKSPPRVYPMSRISGAKSPNIPARRDRLRDFGIAAKIKT